RFAFPTAAVVFTVCLIIKVSWTIHGVWEPFPGVLLRILWPVNKNNLSLLRIVPFFAAVIMVARLVPADARFLRWPVAPPLLTCGGQSLEIFCLGILLSALAHFALSEYDSGVAAQLAVNAVGIAVMCMTAKMIDWYKAMDRAPMSQPALAGRPL